MDVNHIKKILPHRYPLLLVDRVTELVCNTDDTIPNGYIKAYKNVTINEEIFLGHFPSKPVYPGVMIIEGMAQAGGVLAFVSMFGDDVRAAEDKIVYFMTIDKVKFRVPVVPGLQNIYYFREKFFFLLICSKQNSAYRNPKLIFLVLFGLNKHQEQH